MIAVFLLIFGFCHLAFSNTVYYEWNITWVTAAPDGFARPVIGINGQWPCPTVDLEVGDRVIIDVYNGLGNQSTGLHWHGIHQTGTNYMDGSSGVTQCPIPPGCSMRYDFIVDQEGTYWYHSHNLGQYPDGLWGPLIVRGPGFPYADEVDGEIIMTYTDWYHEQMAVLLQQYESTNNENTNNGDEPTPDAALLNAGINTKIFVEPNKTYLIRIICVGNWPGHAFGFDQHDMTVVEVDGVYTEKYPVGQRNVRLATGQRMSILLTTKNDTSQNYGIWDTMDINMLFLDEGKAMPSGYNSNVTGWLVYNNQSALPPAPIQYEFDFVNDVDFIPYDRQPVLEPVDHQIIMDWNSANISDIPRFTTNNETYLPQKVPSLYTALSVGSNYSSDPVVYGDVSPFVLKYGEVVEIVINDYHQNLHPIHLHGHQFQVLERTAPNAGYFPGYYGNYSQTPIRRDTLMVQNQGYAVIRFRADNPDKSRLLMLSYCANIVLRVWLLHCHIEWHVQSGLSATIIEAPDHLGSISIPQDHLDICKEFPLPTMGNAAGNTTDPLNLNGSITAVPTFDNG